MKLRIRHIACLLALTTLTSCMKDEYAGPKPYPTTRIVLVYLAGDNDLAELSLTPELLRQGWTRTGNRCLIYYDAPDAAPKLLSLRGGCQTYPVPFIETVAEYPEENSASAEVFARVIRDVVRMYPADDYGLVFASHASGWLPEGTLSNPRSAAVTAVAPSAVPSAAVADRGSRSIGKDTDPATLAGGATEMELSAFAAAIPDHQFSFIVFESCLMAGVEVAYELRNKTDYLLASSAELLVPGYGVIYSSALHYLFDTRLTVEESLRRFAGSYFKYIDAQSGWRRSATQSIIRTEGLDELAALTEEVFGGSISSIGDGDVADLQHFDRPGSYGDRPAVARYFDFAEYMETLATPSQYAALAAQIDRVVVWKAATPEFLPDQNGFRITNHSGLTVYIPQGMFPAQDEAYTRTEWYKATR